MFVKICAKIVKPSKKLVLAMFSFFLFILILSTSCKKRNPKKTFTNFDGHTKTEYLQTAKRKLALKKIALGIVEFPKLKKFQVVRFSGKKLKIFLPLESEPLAYAQLFSTNELVVETASEIIFSTGTGKVRIIKIASPFLKPFKFSLITADNIAAISGNNLCLFDGRAWILQRISIKGKIGDIALLKTRKSARLLLAGEVGLAESDDFGRNFVFCSPKGNVYERFFCSPFEPIIFASGKNQGFVFSKDNGETWKKYKDPIAEKICDIAFLQKDRALFLGTKGLYEFTPIKILKLPINLPTHCKRLALTENSLYLLGSDGAVYCKNSKSNTFEKLDLKVVVRDIFTYYSKETTRK